MSQMRGRWRAVVSGLTAAVLVSACGGGSSVNVDVQRVSMRLTDSSPGFGLALLDRLLGESDAGNVFISPLSATIALSMAASAAQGETRAAMLRALGLDPNVDPSDELRQTIERLAQSDADAQLELAQAVWAEKGLPLSPAYVAKLRNDYRAELANLDFRSPDAPGVVNRWVEQATHHKITKLVDQFDPTTVAYLVNATYFHALWAAEFKPMHDPVAFHTFTGTTVNLPMMERDESVTELRTPDFVAELLPYKGGRFSAVLLLPKDQLSPKAFANLLTSSRWSQTIDDFHNAGGPLLGGRCKPWSSGADVRVDCDGTLQMPKFKLDYSVDLTQTLGAMGMPIPGAVLPDICSSCSITDVLQKTYLEVDEHGTTASAATGIAVGTALRLPTIIDRPFAFALIDNATDAPLFLGVIGQLS